MFGEENHVVGNNKDKGTYSRKFRIMLKVLGAPDGGEWTGTKMERATGGEVLASYFTSLRDGHIEIPRADKIDTLARVMGFPTQLWFKDLSWWEALEERWARGENIEPALKSSGRGNGSRIASLLNQLIEREAEGRGGSTPTDQELARRSQGSLSEDEVRGLREASIKHPTWAQVLALSDVFGVESSYWTGEEIPWRPSPALLRLTGDEEAYTVFENSLQLSSKSKSMLRILSEELRRQERRERRTGSQSQDSYNTDEEGEAYR